MRSTLTETLVYWAVRRIQEAIVKHDKSTAGGGEHPMNVAGPFMAMAARRHLPDADVLRGGLEQAQRLSTRRRSVACSRMRPGNREQPGASSTASTRCSTWRHELRACRIAGVSVLKHLNEAWIANTKDAGQNAFEPRCVDRPRTRVSSFIVL